MTTIKITKEIGVNDFSVKIYANDIEENLEKELTSWGEVVPAAQWDSKEPQRNGMDFKQINDQFSITGRIDSTSLELNGSLVTDTNVCYIRDILRHFVLQGGTCTFNYGIASDTTNITGTINFTSGVDTGTFYTATGFECFLTRLKIKELPKGGDAGEQVTSNATTGAVKEVPEYYEITLTLLKGSQYS